MKNCSIVLESGRNRDILQYMAPCPNTTQPIQYTNVTIYTQTALGPSTVCGKPISEWQKEGLLESVSVHPLPSAAAVVQMARDVLEATDDEHLQPYA